MQWHHKNCLASVARAPPKVRGVNVGLQSFILNSSGFLYGRCSSKSELLDLSEARLTLHSIEQTIDYCGAICNGTSFNLYTPPLLHPPRFPPILRIFSHRPRVPSMHRQRGAPFFLAALSYIGGDNIYLLCLLEGHNLYVCHYPYYGWQHRFLLRLE